MDFTWEITVYKQGKQKFLVVIDICLYIHESMTGSIIIICTKCYILNY